MGRFILWFLFLVVAVGLTLHFKVEVPLIGDWLGRLPGDLIIRKQGIVLYIPLTTSALLSLALSILSALLFKPSN